MGCGASTPVGGAAPGLPPAALVEAALAALRAGAPPLSPADAADFAAQHGVTDLAATVSTSRRILDRLQDAGA